VILLSIDTLVARFREGKIAGGTYTEFLDTEAGQGQPPIVVLGREPNTATL